MSRYPKKTYLYNGEQLNVSQLMKHSQVSRYTLDFRLKNGWSAERAILLGLKDSDIDPIWEGKDLLIVFDQKIPTVIEEMQPTLNKPYVARHNDSTRKDSTRHFFIITLESNKPLIVYPSDFRILGAADAERTEPAAALNL